MTTLFSMIEEQENTLTPAHLRVADYIRLNADSAAFDTLEVLSQKIGVSTTTVIRFARALGLSGFSELQHLLQNGVQEHLQLPNRLTGALKKDDHETLLDQSFQNDISNITATMECIPAKDLARAVEMIANARHIRIMGMRASFSLAHYCYTRISQIKKNASLVQAVGDLYAEEVMQSNPEDVFVAFLFPRYTSSSITLLRAMHRKGIPIVLITSPENTKVRDSASVLLPCNVTGISFKNSFAAPIALINYLGTALAARDYDKTLQNLTELESLLKENRYITI